MVAEAEARLAAELAAADKVAAPVGSIPRRHRPEGSASASWMAMVSASASAAALRIAWAIAWALG